MEGFIKIPNLPENKVTFAAVGDYPVFRKALSDMGIRIFSPENPVLDSEVSRHADMLICHTGENIIFADPLQDVTPLIKEGFTVYFTEELERNYPLDTRLNTAVGSKYFINNPKSVSACLYKYLENKGLRSISTRQGYTKCSLCFVTENAVITDDNSVYKAVREHFSDVLLISKGDIFLSEKHFGFFGGCTGKINKNTLAVTGELKSHRDHRAIYEFCAKHEVEIKELSKGRLTDIGGILPLKEMR